MVRMRFEVECPGARRVCLAGDFNDWDMEARRMKRVRKGEDLFVANMNLEPGTYQYKYVVDGEWRCCPTAPRVVTDDGIENSVIEVCEE